MDKENITLRVIVYKSFVMAQHSIILLPLWNYTFEIYCTMVFVENDIVCEIECVVISRCKVRCGDGSKRYSICSTYHVHNKRYVVPHDRYIIKSLYLQKRAKKLSSSGVFQWGGVGPLFLTLLFLRNVSVRRSWSPLPNPSLPQECLSEAELVPSS